jgi:hypothetical protein
MMNWKLKPYIPAPVDMDSVARTIAHSAAAIERSWALLSRLSAKERFSPLVRGGPLCSATRNSSVPSA